MPHVILNNILFIQQAEFTFNESIWTIRNTLNQIEHDELVTYMEEKQKNGKVKVS